MSMTQRLWTLRSINGQRFGCLHHELLSALGAPDEMRQNFDGEVELHYLAGPTPAAQTADADASRTIYRCSPAGVFVEASFSADQALIVDGGHVLSVFDWLAGQQDVVDMARFRISLARGIAYDYRNPEHGSITVFGPGHWDALVLDAPG